MALIEMRKDPREVRKALKLLQSTPGMQNHLKAAKEVYLSGKTHAAPMTESGFIDGREDKPWTRI